MPIAKKIYKQSKYFILRSPSLKFILILLLLVIIFVHSLSGDIFKINKIICQMNNLSCSPEITSQFSSLLHQNIFTANLSQVASLKKDYPQWSELKIQKKIPNFLFINIQTLQPRVALKENVSDSPDFYLVDEKGYYWGKKDTASGLPVILIDKMPKVQVGQSVNHSSLSSSLSLIKLLESYQIEFNQLQINDEQILVSFSQFQAIFSNRQDLKRQISSLQLIINESRMGNKDFKKIDLRFEKPVIIF